MILLKLGLYDWLKKDRTVNVWYIYVLLDTSFPKREYFYPKLNNVWCNIFTNPTKMCCVYFSQLQCQWNASSLSCRHSPTYLKRAHAPSSSGGAPGRPGLHSGDAHPEGRGHCGLLWRSVHSGDPRKGRFNTLQTVCGFVSNCNNKRLRCPSRFLTRL